MEDSFRSLSAHSGANMLLSSSLIFPRFSFVDLSQENDRFYDATDYDYERQRARLAVRRAMSLHAAPYQQCLQARPGDGFTKFLVFLSLREQWR